MARPSQSPQALAAIKDLIINAARKIMFEQGVDAISIRRVAAVAGVGPSSIYYYFKNRDDILFSLWQSVTNTTDVKADALQAISDPVERLVRLCTGIVRFARDNPAEYQLICTLEPMVKLNNRTPFSKGYGLLHNTISEIVKQSHPDLTESSTRTKTSQLAQAHWASIHGCIRLPLDMHSFPLEDPIVLCQLLSNGLLDTLKRRETFVCA